MVNPSIYYTKMKRRILKNKVAISAVLVCVLLMGGRFNYVNAQSAENLNLGTPVKPPYNCYGRLAEGCPNAEKLGWKVGVQFYTFHKYTFFEGIDLTKALGLHYIEGTMGMRISPESDEKMWVNISQEWKDKIKKRLNDAGVKSISVYAWMNGSGDGFEDLVKFCKEMGFTIITDPKRTDNGGKPVEFYEEILKKYGVTMAFTNHPKGAAYWNPDFTVADTKERSQHIGASLDLGHQLRGGFDTYEVAKKYIEIGKMYHFHMRDVNEIGPHGLDVSCGDGKGRLKEIYQMMFDKKIKPLMMLEYEHDFDNPMPYLIKSVNWINKVCGEMIEADHQKKQTGALIQLPASEAISSEGMYLQGSGAEATIHAWNNTDQTIKWNTNLKPGNYLVRIRYVQPAIGSAMTLTADGQEIAHLFKPTFTWYDYITQDLGVIRINKQGATDITVRGIQLALKVDNKDSNKLKAVEALPDVNWIELIPTTLDATSQPVNIFTQFKGKPLFDSKTWNGWKENSPNSMDHFRISKEAIVGGNMKEELAHNQFIRTTKTYDNFELHLKYKVNAKDDSYNGGIQFRSVPCTIAGREFEMVGYQADILSWKKGVLYDESRRWDFLGEQLGTPPNYKLDKWNDYVIRCEGTRIRIWLNGVKTTDYIEAFAEDAYPGIGAIAQDGYIALQIHEGKACEIWYKDILIQELK